MRPAHQHRDARHLPNGIVQRAAALAGTAAVADLGSAVDEHGGREVPIVLFIGTNLRVKIQAFAGLHQAGHGFAAAHDVFAAAIVPLSARIVLKEAAKRRDGGLIAHGLVALGHHHQVGQHARVDVPIAAPHQHLGKTVHEVQNGDFAACAGMDIVDLSAERRFGVDVGRFGERSHIFGRHHAVRRGILRVQRRHILVYPGANDIAYIAIILRQHVGGIHRVDRDRFACVNHADHVAFAVLQGAHANGLARGYKGLDLGGVQRRQTLDARRLILRVGNGRFILILRRNTLHLDTGGFGLLSSHDGVRFLRQRGKSCCQQEQACAKSDHASIQAHRQNSFQLIFWESSFIIAYPCALGQGKSGNLHVQSQGACSPARQQAHARKKEKHFTL